MLRSFLFFASLLWALGGFRGIPLAQSSEDPTPSPLPKCRGALLGENDLSERSKCLKKVTFTLYMAADNDLSPYALWDLTELSSIGSDENTDLIVHLDLKGKAGTGVYRVLRKADLFRVNRTREDYAQLRLSDFALQPVEMMSERACEASSPRKLQKTLSISETIFPSEKKITVLWGHGYGWKGFGTDETLNDDLSILEIKRAFKRANHTPDVLITDSCFLQSVEVISLLTDTTRIIVGSDRIQPSFGLPYRRLLKRLKKLLKEEESSAVIRLGMETPSLFEQVFREQNRVEEAFSLSALPIDQWKKTILPAFQAWAAATASELDRHRFPARPGLLIAADEARINSEQVDLVAFSESVLQNEKKMFSPEYGESTRIWIETLRSSGLRSAKNQVGQSQSALSFYFPQSRSHWEANRSHLEDSKTPLNGWVSVFNRLF
jgi:hypothetical protein